MKKKSTERRRSAQKKIESKVARKKPKSSKSQKTMNTTENSDMEKSSQMGSDPKSWCTKVLERGAEAVSLEYKAAESVFPPEKIKTFMENESANRYRNQMCLEETRVKVEGGKPNDYIHANYVTITDDKQRQFICAQGPLEETVEQFLRMILAEKVSHVVMLCDLVENKQPKCASYCPDPRKPFKFGDLTVTHHGKSVEGGLTVTVLNLSDGQKNETVRHVHWTGWPDQGVPSDFGSMQKLLKYLKASKVLVHCSAGVGRTGTVVLMAAAIQLFEKCLPVQMTALLQKIRDQRAGAVQNELQYLFVHRLLLETFKDAADKEKMDKWHRDYEAIIADRKQKRRRMRESSDAK